MRSKIYILLAIGILMLSAADVNAQVKGGSFTITPFAGYVKNDPMGLYENTETYGLALGYNFSERFGVEVTYNTVDTEIVPDGLVTGGWDLPFPPPPWVDVEETVVVEGGADVEAYNAGVELLFHIYPGQKFAPYVALGLGYGEYEYLTMDGMYTKKDHNVPMGFGFKYFVTDMIAFRGDLRAVFPYNQNNIRATVGVSFQFGGE